MFIRFIAHAGLYVEENGFSVLIDPWFFDSTPEFPVIESIGGGFKTIDFQIPKTQEKIENYTPDIILVSHFHPHHSPVRDVNLLLEQSKRVGKEVSIFYPKTNDGMEENLTKNLPLGISRNFLVPDESVVAGPFTITAKSHTVPFHLVWTVKSNTGSIIHIADGALNKDESRREVDPVWRELKPLHADFLFLTSGGHSDRIITKEGVRKIVGPGVVTAVEAAKVVQSISPKNVGLIGIYNHSIWKNRVEYVPPTSQIEEEFEWAHTWLSQTIKSFRLRPGVTFLIGEEDTDKRIGILL